MRRVLLTVNDEVVKSFEDVPDLLLKQIKAFEPLLESSTTNDFPLKLNTAEEIEPAKKMMQWLQRDIPLGELVTGMVQFRALARCADKFAVLQLLDELAVSSFIFWLRPLFSLIKRLF